MKKAMGEIQKNQKRLDNAEGYSNVWELVKDNVKVVMKQERPSMMLFLDDLPLRLGAYHPLGTNNIVLNRALVETVEATTDSKRLLNAFIYSLLLHEYIHGLGVIREAKVRTLVYKVSKSSFGTEHVVTKLAELGPWSLLRNLPIDALRTPKRVMKIVKDFEKANKRYIV